MNLFKSIREAAKTAKDFEARLKEVERNVIYKPYGGIFEAISGSISGLGKPKTLNEKVDSNIEKIKALQASLAKAQADHELLIKFLKVKKVESKTKTRYKLKK